jgi:hypothetical protein
VGESAEAEVPVVEARQDARSSSRVDNSSSNRGDSRKRKLVPSKPEAAEDGEEVE